MCQPCRQVSPWCRLPGKPFWRFRMWPPPRSSRRWPSSCLDKIPVCLPEVELVRLDFLWQHAEALFIEFQLHGEVGRFVVGVPTEMVDVGVTVHDAGANLRTELDLGLAPNNRTEVRLVDADDASLYPPKNNELLIDNNNLQIVVWESIFFNQVVAWLEISHLWVILTTRWISAHYDFTVFRRHFFAKMASPLRCNRNAVTV